MSAVSRRSVRALIMRQITRSSELAEHADFLTLRSPLDYTYKFNTCRSCGLTVVLCLQEEPAATCSSSSMAAPLKGDCFAKAHISTAEATPRQDARIPRTHEDRRRPQSSRGSPQEGTPSPHARLVPGVWIFRARRGWCAAASSTPCTAPASAARVPTSPFFSAPIYCRSAGSGSASRRRWAVRWCAIASGGGFERSCAAIARKFPRDGTS